MSAGPWGRHLIPPSVAKTTAEAIADPQLVAVDRHAGSTLPPGPNTAPALDQLYARIGLTLARSGPRPRVPRGQSMTIDGAEGRLRAAC